MEVPPKTKKAQECQEKRAAAKRKAEETGKHYCNKCFHVKEIDEFVPRKTDGGPSTLCNVCHEKQKNKIAEPEPESESDSESEDEPAAKKPKTLPYRYNKVKKRIEKKNTKRPPEKQLAFDLTPEQYSEILSRKTCRFCPEQGGSLDDYTVDRKDDRIGYTIENCQCAHHHCNYSKGSSETTKFNNDEEYISHCADVTKHCRLYKNPSLYNLRVYPTRGFVILN
jgi:hypothetical protein